MHPLSVHATRLAAAIAALGVLIHLAALAGGPDWYTFFGAPPAIVASARAGTWLAPAGTAAIAILMGVCTAYACSAAGLLPRLPLLRTGLAVIATICLLRALILIPLAYRHPQLCTPFEIVAALVWGAAGCGFVAGFFVARPARRPGRRGTVEETGCDR